MTKKEKQLRLSELVDFIQQQEELLSYGSKRIQELNDECIILEKEVKGLKIEKSKLVEELVAITQSIEIYSNF